MSVKLERPPLEILERTRDEVLEVSEQMLGGREGPMTANCLKDPMVVILSIEGPKFIKKLYKGNSSMKLRVEILKKCQTGYRKERYSVFNSLVVREDEDIAGRTQEEADAYDLHELLKCLKNSREIKVP